MTETQADTEQLQREIEQLRRELSGQRTERARRVRSGVTWTLTVLAVLATSLALLAIWMFRTLTTTDLFVERVGSVIEQPEVAEAVGQAAAGEIVDALDLEDKVADALPDDVAVVAGPLTNAAQNYLAQGVAALAQTDQFQRAWDASLTAGHRVSIAILSGQDTEAVQNAGGVILIDLAPVANQLLAEGSDFVSDLLGRDITAPTVTSDDLDAAVAALEQELGVDIPADYGQIVLVDSSALASAQAAYQTMRVATWLAPLAALVLIGLAVAVSMARLRTGLSIVIGTAVVLLLVAVILRPLESAIVNAVSGSGLESAVAASFVTVTSSLLTGIVIVVAVGVLAAGGFALTGDSRVAVSGRSALAQTPSLATRHRGWFLIGGALVALLLLAVLPGISWGQVGVVALLYAGYALAVVLAPQVSPAKQDAGSVEAAPAGDG